MPQERDSNYPMPTLDEFHASSGTSAQKAARIQVARHINGIPRRAFLLGENDEAVVVRGVADFCAEVETLLHKLEGRLLTPDVEAVITRVKAMMTQPVL